MKEKSEEQGIQIWAIMILIILLLLGICLISLSAAVQAHSALWAMVLRDLGFVFTPVAILALFYEHFAQKAHSRYVAKEVGRQIIIEVEKKIDHVPGHRGNVQIYSNRDAINLNEYFTDAKNNIDILVTNLSSLEIHAGLLAKLANDGVKVRIIALNPQSEFVKSRFKELVFQSQKQFYCELVSSLRTFCLYKENKVDKDKKSNFLIHVFDNPPSLILFQRDSQIIVGFILRQGKSRDSIHIEFDCSQKTSQPCQDYIKHFQLIWNDSRDINLAAIDQICSKECDIQNKCQDLFAH